MVFRFVVCKLSSSSIPLHHQSVKKVNKKAYKFNTYEKYCFFIFSGMLFAFKGDRMRNRMKNKRNIQINALLVTIIFVLLLLVNTSLAANVPDYTRLQPISDNMSAPTAIALDKDGCVLVVESINNRLLIYSQGGTYMKTLSNLKKPISVAVDSSLRTYIGNKQTGNVEVYDADLELLFKLGNGNNEFDQPGAIAIAGDGRIYVVDSSQDVVKVYNSDGTSNSSFGSSGGGNGEFNFPTSITIDTVTDELIVADRKFTTDMFGAAIEGARVQVFDMDGVYKRSFGEYGIGEGLIARPMGVTVDGESRVYVTDSQQHIVHAYDNVGTYLGSIFDTDVQMRTPLGIAIGDSNRLYMASLNTGKIEIYGIDTYTNMGVTPISLSFEGEVGGSNPASQNVEISNDGPATLNWTVTKDSSWLTISVTEGSTETSAVSNISIGVNLDGLSDRTYTGSVTVTAASGVAEVISVELVVAPSSNPLIANAGGPYADVEGQVISLDGSASSGSITLYEWDVDNDGTYEYSSSSSTQNHTYTQIGTYTVKLRISDGSNTETITTTATISDSTPTAGFTVDSISGTTPLSVNFTNTSTGYDQALTYVWDFDDDGESDSTETNPSYTFTDAGIYTVELSVTDSDGSTNTLKKTNYITVSASGCQALPVKLNGNHYGSMQAALNSAGNGSTMRLRQSQAFSGMTFNRNIVINLDGGYDCDYESTDGMTTLEGDMVISDGTVVIGNIIIQ